MLPASVPVDLTWNAPAECPARDVVVDEVARVLSNSQTARVPVAARVDVSRDELGRWHASLSLGTRDAHSERTLDAESCPAIASATAVIVAIAVEGGMPEPGPQAPSPVQREAPALAAKRERTSQVVIALAGTLDANTLPSPAPGVPVPGVEAALGWAYSWSKWRLRALGSTSVFLSQNSTPLPPGKEAAGEYGHFDLLTASARACGSLVRSPFDVGPCLGVEIDRMTGTGAAGGPAHPSRRTSAWATALGSVLASWSFSGHVAILLRGEGFYAPAPTTFVVNNPGKPHIDVYTPNHVGARVALGVEVRFF